LTEEWRREIGRKRKQAARTAREQAGAGKSRMCRIAGQIPAGRVTPPLQFKCEYQRRELGLLQGARVYSPWKVYGLATRMIARAIAASVQRAVDERMTMARNVGSEDSDLAVRNLALPNRCIAAPLRTTLCPV
jgi:hypothetical protein